MIIEKELLDRLFVNYKKPGEEEQGDAHKNMVHPLNLWVASGSGNFPSVGRNSGVRLP